MALLTQFFMWGFVTHAAIEGYSRKIMYLQSSTNNKACTVLSLVHSWSLWKTLDSPLAYELIRVENVDVDVNRHMYILYEDQIEEALYQAKVFIARELSSYGATCTVCWPYLHLL